MTIQEISLLVNACQLFHADGGLLMRTFTASPALKPGDRVLALLPLRFAEEPATVISPRRDGSITVVLDARPARPLVCCD